MTVGLRLHFHQCSAFPARLHVVVTSPTVLISVSVALRLALGCRWCLTGHFYLVFLLSKAGCCGRKAFIVADADSFLS